MNQAISVALPKGRLGEKAYALFAGAGYECPELLEDNRRLTFENEAAGVRYFWVKPSDVAIYVERGAADVVVDVEVGVLGPQRVVHLQRHRHEAPGERRDHVQEQAQLAGPMISQSRRRQSGQDRCEPSRPVPDGQALPPWRRRRTAAAAIGTRHRQQVHYPPRE